MTYILLIIVIILCGLCYKFYKDATKTHVYNDEIDKQNQELLKNNELLSSRNTQLTNDIGLSQNKINSLDQLIQTKNGELQRITSQTTAAIESQKVLSQQAFESYIKTLEYSYQQVDKDYDLRIQRLKDQEQLVRKDLDVISATRAAARAALQKEQEVKENKDNYRLLVSDTDLEDIHRLERVKRELHKPRILSMLIWSTYYQPLAKKRFPEIIQDKTKMGIYKITNIETDECYIGQSVDIYKRWTDHCKCGLGIDTPPGNKLYKAMQEYGLENFTFEVIAECSKEELNDKERYFIKLYEADTFGYNGTIGNKK